MMHFCFFSSEGVEQKTIGGGEVDGRWTKRTKEGEPNVWSISFYVIVERRDMDIVQSCCLDLKFRCCQD